MLLAWALSLLLAACGGGGGGGGTAAPVLPPTITAQPADTQVVAGGSASFSVGASGSGLSYQWQRSNDSGASWVAIAGATGASYTLAATTLQDNAARLRVLVSQGGAQTLSSAVTLSVSPLVLAPAISVQPQAVLAVEGGSASFSVTATGTAPSYRWQTRSGSADWADAVADSSPTFTLNALTLASDALQVRVQVSNSAGTATSDAATLSVTPAPVSPGFSTQPAAVAVTAPGAASFSVVTTGTPAPSLQWQRSNDGGSSFSNIASATGTSFTLATTSLADNGARFRAVATNASGSATSAAALLTVTAALAAPAITTEPADSTVVAGQAVTLQVLASGTPAPGYQWQLSTDGGSSFANVNGATGTSYSFTTTVADNGRWYRAVASNSQGSATSRAARLTVTAVPGSGSGLAWSTGQALETGDGAVANVLPSAAIDDQGRVAVLFGKHDGTRVALHAVRGTPGTASTAPSYGAPVVIDGLVPFDSSFTPWLARSPGGNLLAAWVRRAPCTASTYSTALTCSYVVVARFLAATETWETPLLLADMPTPAATLHINDAGDIAIVHAAWKRLGTGALSHGRAVSWMANGQNTWQRVTFFPEAGPDSFDAAHLALDAAGNFVVFGTGQASSAQNADAVAYRGNVRSAGLGAREVLDSLDSAVTFDAAWAAPGGQMAAAWHQLTPGVARATTFIATLDSTGGAWAVRDTTVGFASFNPAHATFTSDGRFLWHVIGRCTTLRHAPGGWLADTTLPAQACDSSVQFNTQLALGRDGNLLVVDVQVRTPGRWLLYDDTRREVVDSFTSDLSGGPGYVLGVPSLPAGLPLLAPNGVGAYISVNSYDTLPSAAGIAGSTRGITSLWGWALR